MTPIRTLLSSGRTPLALGRVDEVIALIEQHPRKISQLIECLWDENPSIANRAADAIEKLTRKNKNLPLAIDAPEKSTKTPADLLIARWRTELIELLAEAKHKKLRWNLALFIPRLTLTPAECRTISQILHAQYLDDPSSIIKTSALQAFAHIARQQPSFLPEVLDILRIHGRSGTPAMRARSRLLLKKFESKK